MNDPIRVLSSMATKALLAELGRAYEERSGRRVVIESVGGVDAKKRVLAGEAFDLVVLSSEAIEELLLAGRLVSGSKLDLVRSGVAVAVRAGAPRPDLSSEEAVRRAVLEARTVGFSTGPSGVKLAKLLEHWGIAEVVRDRIVTPPPGVPVGTLVASGAVDLGFQQLSELIHLEGIDIVGTLPAAIQIITVFSAAVAVTSAHADTARALLAFLGSPASSEAKLRQGMEPA
jgi:molybdate transport system substrate-binding protein